MMLRLSLLISLCAVPQLAFGFDWTGAKWGIPQGQSVPYEVNNVLSSDMPDNDCLEGVQLGYDAWTNLSCSYMAWNMTGRTDNTGWGAADGSNVVTWRASNWGDSSAALAITANMWGGLNSLLQDADIKFNGVHHSWAHFIDGMGARGATDVASVSAHEVGHALGLGHSDIGGSTMWPSTGPGDIGGRSLGADDIAGACDIYPSGGDVPVPDMDPVPAEGTAEFGDPCADERCVESLFCINDGRDLYCSRVCTPGDDSCGEGFYCAYLSGGGGACVRGEDPQQNLASFGESCGDGVNCEQGLVCVNDADSVYCTGPCANGMCPSGYFCATLQNGDSICAQGESEMMGDLPGEGDACTPRGLCAEGLFCLNDPTNLDEESGRAIPYCTRECGSGCPGGFRCIQIQPSGSACQLIPTPGNREMGDECWVNPEEPWQAPTCGNGLVCVDYVIENQRVTEKGYCTQNCDKQECCPSGWGCIELTPVFGQCQADASDSPRFECEGEVPTLDGGSGPGGSINQSAGDEGGCAGCQGTEGPSPYAALLGAALLWLSIRRRRRPHER